jgi:hypothetical protein
MELSRSDLYRDFLDVILSESNRQRNAHQRRMVHVFLWCFVIPALLVLGIAVLVQLKVLPRKFRLYLDWISLIFPVLYAFYFLGAEVVSQLPRVFRLGGVSLTLAHCQEQNLWRSQVCSLLAAKRPLALTEDWRWVSSAFQMDLDALQYRARYLTALAGAVFFLIMQGLDSITGESKWPAGPDPTGGVSLLPPDVLFYGNLGQFIGLGLFLVLLYLSSSQNVQQLKRFKGCVDLLAEGGWQRTAAPAHGELEASAKLARN